MLYRINIDINDDDYIKFNIFHQFCTAAEKRLVMVSRIIIALIPLFMCLFYVTSSDDTEDYIGMIAVDIILAVVFFFAAKPIVKFFAKFTVRLAIKNGKKPYSPLSTIEFYENYFIEYTSDNKSHVNYSAIENVYKSGTDMLYLFCNSINA